MASFQKLKKWAGEFGVSKGVGEKKQELTDSLVGYMKENKDELDEEQLEWLSEQTDGDEKPVKKKKEKAKSKGEDKPDKKATSKKGKEEKPKKGKEEKPKKGKEEKPKEGKGEKPKGKGKKKEKEKAPEEGTVSVDAEPQELRAFAEELEISTKGYKKFSEEDWEKLANQIYATVDDMDESDREDLSEELFAWYTTIKSVEEEESQGETEEAQPETGKAEIIEVPSKVKLKRWASSMEIEIENFDSLEDVAKEVLSEYQGLDDDDKEELPDSLVEWADAQLSRQAVEPEEEEGIELPDTKTLRTYGKEVGLKLKDMKKAEDDQDLARIIVEAYDEDDREEYSSELNEFYTAIVGGFSTPEGEDESNTGQLVGWLAEAGYEASDFEDWDYDELVEKLVEDYKDKDSREDLPKESIEFLKENRPDLFEKKKGKKKKKKGTKE